MYVLFSCKGGGETESLGITASGGPIVPALDVDECGALMGW
jgi:hypothetical protein